MASSRGALRWSWCSVLIRAYYRVFSLLVVNAEAELLLCLPQRLQAQVTLGQQRLQALLCQAVHSSEQATEEEK